VICVSAHFMQLGISRRNILSRKKLRRYAKILVTYFYCLQFQPCTEKRNSRHLFQRLGK